MKKMSIIVGTLALAIVALVKFPVSWLAKESTVVVSKQNAQEDHAFEVSTQKESAVLEKNTNKLAMVIGKGFRTEFGD